MVFRCNLYSHGREDLFLDVVFHTKRDTVAAPHKGGAGMWILSCQEHGHHFRLPFWTSVDQAAHVQRANEKAEHWIISTRSNQRWNDRHTHMKVWSLG